MRGATAVNASPREAIGPTSHVGIGRKEYLGGRSATDSLRAGGLPIVLVALVLFQLAFSSLFVGFGLVGDEDLVYASVMIAYDSVIVGMLIAQLAKDVGRGGAALLAVSYAIRLVYIYYVTLGGEELVSDMAGYQAAAVLFARTGEVSTYGGPFFAIPMGMVYKVFGVQTIMVRYVNSTLVVLCGAVVLRSLKLLHVRKTVSVFLVGWLVFAYPLFTNSTTVHREAMICLWVTLSLAAFIRWFKGGGVRWAITAVALSLPALGLHAGTVGYVAGLSLAMVLYRPSEGRFRLTMGSVLAAAAIALLALLLFFGAFDVFFRKFGDRTFESIVVGAEQSKGGSGYTVGGSVKSPLGAVFYSPLRMLYFYCSPMPWDWRGLGDIVAFVICSIPCALVLVLGLREGWPRSNNRHRNLIVALMVSLLAFGFVFGWGVRNAGTAMRHRNKVIAVEVAVLALCIDGSPSGNMSDRVGTKNDKVSSIN